MNDTEKTISTLFRDKDGSKENVEEKVSSEESASKEKVKAIFLKIDTSRDGWLSRSEFKTFFKELGCEENISDQVFTSIVQNGERITFSEFYDYYDQNINSNGFKSQKKVNRVWDLQPIAALIKKQAHAFHNIHGTIINKWRSAALQVLTERTSALIEKQAKNKVENALVRLYSSQEEDELADYITSRWDAFINFKRKGSDGEIVMSSDENVTDALPGTYDLLQLVMDQFDSDVIDSTPKHIIVKPVKWISPTTNGSHGQLVCPKYWNGTIPVDIGTNKNLSYYGACLATKTQEKIALMHRQATVDFVYSANYYDNYITQGTEETARGCGLEMHAFHHMVCPLEENSGYLLLGKLITSEEIHLTAFKIPTNHVLYVPPMVIHSNDHMIGKWRTMLADDVFIDHVYFVN